MPPALSITQARPMPDETARLTTAAASGDDRAFAALYRAWFDRALALAYRLTGRDESFCLDVVQDAMLRAARKVPPGLDEDAFRRWLTRVVHTCALDRLRAERRRLRRESLGHGRPGDGEDHARGVELDERIEQLRAAIARLEPDDRSLLLLRFVRGCTLDQAAGANGITGGAAHGRIRRLLKRLRSDLDPSASERSADRDS
ncbi:MAG: RNA polymerase sigma factor [Phycisphaerales bacterium]|nr:RNA polymerase sigma factor [Phycisphaerales bacterium]